MIMNDTELLLSELLAIIHHDGGHYQTKYGTVKACGKAIDTITAIYYTSKILRDENDELTEELHDLKIACNVKED